jgi:heme-degrading monooxygenase HmoA
LIVSLTIVRYRKAFVPFALLSMAIHRLPLMLQKGCNFWKLMGSGRGGTFSLDPDWQQWALMTVWDDEQALERFYRSSFIASWWNRLATEQWTVWLEPLQSHGKWDGKEPFKAPNVKDHTGPVAVLTRATIKMNRLKNFWAHVDEASQAMAEAKGYIASFGVGEAPAYRQATFSVWESLDDVKAYAYGSRTHADIIKKTRAEGWYSEELFARFKPLKAWGTLNGIDPLHGKLNLNDPYESNS